MIIFHYIMILVEIKIIPCGSRCPSYLADTATAKRITMINDKLSHASCIVDLDPLVLMAKILLSL